VTGQELLKKRADRPRVCRHLRAKGPADPDLDADWQEGLHSNASHWCLATMDAVGPDDRVVHALDCRAGRPCFEAPRETRSTP